jgi:hypothetical protein
MSKGLFSDTENFLAQESKLPFLLMRNFGAFIVVYDCIAPMRALIHRNS